MSTKNGIVESRDVLRVLFCVETDFFRVNIREGGFRAGRSYRGRDKRRRVYASVDFQQRFRDDTCGGDTSSGDVDGGGYRSPWISGKERKRF